MKRVDIVCYTSKLCNLRCRYCYELPMLGDASRMSFAEIEQMFTNIEIGYRNVAEPITINFYWHGGEPLLIPPEYYRRIFQIQQRVFAASIHHILNSVQSNFTVMTEKHIDLLRDFSGVGASLDLFTDLRVDRHGNNSEKRVLDNLERVRAAGIDVGGITVLSRQNIPHIADIYQFYRERRMTFRVLPLEHGQYEPGQEFEVGPRDILAAYCKLADLWLADDAPVRVMPLDRYLFLVMRANEDRGNRVRPHDPGRWASVLLVDTNGSVFTYGERFQRTLGNLFTTSLDRILGGPDYNKAAQATRDRIRATCEPCPYYRRACTGDPVGESLQDFAEYNDDGSVRCIVAHGIIQHIEKRLMESRNIANGTTHDAARVLAGRAEFALS